MSKRLLVMGTLAFFFLVVFGEKPSWGHSGAVDFDDHWLAAACTQAPVNGRLVGKVVETDFGPAVQPIRKFTGTLMLYCNVEPDLFHNWIQIFAEDNSPSTYVTATLFQQDIEVGTAPTELVSVTTTDQPGVQRAELFFDPPFEPDELNFMYFIKIEVHRSDPTAKVRVYSVSLRDVL